MFTQEVLDQLKSVVENAVHQAIAPRIAPRYMDYEQAGQYMGRTAEAVRAYVREGFFPASRKGQKVWIDREDIDLFMKNHKGYRH